MDQAPLTKIRRQAASLRQQVLESLREAIVTGKLEPKRRLTERELTQMMSVSRTVVREALRQLEAEGLVDVIPHKGPVVRELRQDEAKDLYRIRAVLEGLAARIFVEQANRETVNRLQKAVQSVVASYEKSDTSQVLSAKTRFYDQLYNGAESETLSSMLSTLHARIWQWRSLGLTHPQRSDTRSHESIKNLKLIMNAIEKGDADTAEKIVREEANQAAAEVMRLLAYNSVDESVDIALS